MNVHLIPVGAKVKIKPQAQAALANVEGVIDSYNDFGGYNVKFDHYDGMFFWFDEVEEVQ